MRKICFRAWDKRKKMMAFNVQNEYDTIHDVEYSDGSGPCMDCFGDYLEDENWVVMQFTGLLDKNGKEVYEGDIIQSPFGSVGIVKWEDQSTNLESGMIGFSLPFWGDYSKDHEIVGNVWENPNLIIGDQ